MKLTGKMMLNAMMYNNIKAKDGIVTIHNTDYNGYGFVSTYTTECQDELEFTLSKKDYQTLSIFDEMDVKVNTDKITVKTKSGKITLANLVDISVYLPNTENTYETNIKPSDFLMAEKFAGDDATRVQLNGCNCTSDGYFISDTHCFFVRGKDLFPMKDTKTKICIPKESFKYIGDMDTCFTDEKVAVFLNQAQGKMFYTSLINVSMFVPKLNYDETFVIKVDKSELLNTAKMLKNYNKALQMKYIDDNLHLIIDNENNKFDIVIQSELIKGSHLQIYHNIDNLIKIVGLIDGAETILTFNKIMCFYKGNDFSAGSTHCVGQEKLEVA